NFQWVQSSLEILRQFHQQGGQRVVMAGTCAEYDWNYGYCSELLTPRNPQTIYGVCKKSLQEMFEVYCKQYNLSGAWGRIFFVYGPYENPERLIPYVTCSLLKNEVALCGSGEQFRDFLYVEDAANAFVSLLNSDVTGAINIASGQPIQIKKIVQKIATITDKPQLVQLGPKSMDNQNRSDNFLVANINRLVSELNWQQKFNLDEGLNLTVNWWINNLK
ncbi:MAG TPA: NAD(P)-dependent oxidoreductase, partial [Allocoleopsis sp.]